VRRIRERRQPVRAVITEAEESIPDQLRRREIRYAAMMGLRAVCVLVAVLVTAAKVPYAMVWVSLCLVGMILLPWIAVLVANDRPPKKSSQFRSHLGGHPAPERALPPANPVIDVRPEREPRILEHRPED
jgi:Flp pilus assembly protein TadB